MEIKLDIQARFPYSPRHKKEVLINQLNKWNGSNTTKDSTMFPTWMPVTHVRTLIALKYPETRANPVVGVLYSENARSYIKHGVKLNLAKSGDTAYTTT